MNLLLLHEADFYAPNLVKISDHRLQHLLQVQKVQLGEQLKAGLINGLCGQAEIIKLTQDAACLKVQLEQPPPAKLPLILVLALPRPKMLRRILQSATSMGVAKIVLVNSYRVEKSFWQTPILQEQTIKQQLLLGLEQARDTVLPQVILEPRFKPFVQDRLPELAANSLKLVAHPGDYAACPRELNEPVCLAVGPEGGWIPYEVQLLGEAGFTPIQLGPRILRVETAVTTLLAKLF